jgi:hypothetical protein
MSESMSSMEDFFFGEEVLASSLGLTAKPMNLPDLPSLIHAESQ